MRLLYLALAIMCLVPAAPAGTAQRTTSPPELVALASQIAQRPVAVRCYAPEEYIDSWTMDPFEYYGAWGYVNKDNRRIIHLASEVCVGALAVIKNDPDVPNWEKAIGVRVLAHEALHSRLWPRWENEAWVECYALKLTRPLAMRMGAVSAQADDYLAYALAEHWRVVDFAPRYHLKSCKMPYFFPDDGPAR